MRRSYESKNRGSNPWGPTMKQRNSYGVFSHYGNLVDYSEDYLEISIAWRDELERQPFGPNEYMLLEFAPDGSILGAQDCYHL